MSDTLYENYAPTIDNWDNVWGANWTAQTFTPSVEHTITSVKLNLQKKGTPTGNFVVSIQATTGGHANGTEICTGSIACSSITADVDAEYEIALGASSGALASGTKYAIVGNVVNGTSDVNGVRFNGKNPSGGYSGGMWDESSDSGANWSSVTGGDFAFKEYGIPTTVNYTLTTAVTALSLGGQDSTVTSARSILTSVANISITGINSILARGYRLVCSVGQIVITGIDALLTTALEWTNQNKSATISATNIDKNDITPANITKHDLTPTNTDKNNISPSNTTKHSISFTNQSKS